MGFIPVRLFVIPSFHYPPENDHILFNLVDFYTKCAINFTRPWTSEHEAFLWGFLAVVSKRKKARKV